MSNLFLDSEFLDDFLDSHLDEIETPDTGSLSATQRVGSTELDELMEADEEMDDLDLDLDDDDDDLDLDDDDDDDDDLDLDDDDDDY